MTEHLNIADRLRGSAEHWPNQIAVVKAVARNRAGQYRYRTWSFSQLQREADCIAAGLIAQGVRPGDRLVLMVPPSFEFIALTFGFMRAGVVVVLIDPGMGRSHIFRCLEEIEPDGFAAIPIVQAIRVLNRRRFPKARFQITVEGRRWLWGGMTYRGLVDRGAAAMVIAASKREPNNLQEAKQRSATSGVHNFPVVGPQSPAAIIFTSGSTGPPKGVLYEHSMFNAQVELLQEFYAIQPGEIDLPGFPLFGLFNAAMGVTTIIPDMNPTKPAQVDPQRIITQMNDWHVTQAFGSPAIWNRVGRHCEATGTKLPVTLRRVLSAGAPVPIPVIKRMRQAFSHPEADIHTPYGATESLPVASICGREVLEETAPLTRRGRGTCVGRVFPGIKVKIIAITAGPIRSLADVTELPRGEIGEIIVSGLSTTREYFCRADATEAAKIGDVAVPDSSLATRHSLWHRMGDVGYFDDQGRLWFCGRKAHLVETNQGRLFTIPCEAIFNNHSRVFRSALVGIGNKPAQRPVIVVEPEAGQFPNSLADESSFRSELLQLAKANPLTSTIDTLLFHESLPVDIRHNVKIFREKLGPWAEQQLHRVRSKH